MSAFITHRRLLGAILFAGGVCGAAQPRPSYAGGPINSPIDRHSTGPRLAATRVQARPGFAESLGRRASFTRDYIGAFASPHGDDTTDTASMPAHWSNGKTVGFAWSTSGKVHFASYARTGKPAVPPEIVCDGEAPVLTSNDTMFAVTAKSGVGSVLAVRDADGWITSTTLGAPVTAIAFSPRGEVFVAGNSGVHRLVANEFQQVNSENYEQPSLAFDSSGTSHVAHVRNGRIYFDETDLGEGTSPALLFTNDGSGALAYLHGDAVALRRYTSGSWQEPELLAAGRRAAWPAVGKSSAGVRVSFIGPAAVGPPALWLVPLPEKEPVLMPSVEGNVVEAWLILHFALRQNRDLYRPHDVDVLVNDLPVAQFKSTVPDGRYLFKLNPAHVFTSPGGAALNRVAVKSRHMNAGHYSVSSDYQLIVRTDWSEHWNFGSENQSAAESGNAESGERPTVNHDVPDLTILANGLDLPVQAPSGGKLKLDVQVANIGEARSQPAQLTARIEGAPAHSPIAVAELDPGELTTVPLELAYDGNAAKLELEIAGAHKDFDAGNDSLKLTLWTKEIERRQRAERLRQAEAAGYQPETTAPAAQTGHGLSSEAIVTGIELNVGAWVPAFDPHGWWGVTPAGGDPKAIKEKTSRTNALALAPGEYDVYWHQGYLAVDVCLAKSVRVETNKVAHVNADSGFAVECAPWVPQFDGFGWWGVTEVGADPEKPLMFTHNRKPILVPPGRYDIYWKQDYTAPPILLQSAVQAAEHELVKLPAGSGLQLVRDPRIPEFDGFGWWGVVRKGAPHDKPLTFTHGSDALLLKPDVYDILWKQNYTNRPVAVAVGVTVTSGTLTEVPANTGVELRQAGWVPKYDGYGWWGVALPGETEALNTSVEPGMILLPDGTYDVLWKQEYTVPPVALARSVTIAAGKIEEVHVGSGVAIEAAQWVPKFDAYGWWGAVTKDGSPSEPINWNAKKAPLVLPVGEYDIYWKQNYTEKPILLSRGVVVKTGELATIRAHSGLAVKLPPLPESDKPRSVTVRSSGTTESIRIKREIDRREKIGADGIAGNMHFVLPPGTYDVEVVESGNETPLALKSAVTVREGSRDIVQMEPVPRP